MDSQSARRLPTERSLAWRQLDVHLLGRYTRRLQSRPCHDLGQEERIPITNYQFYTMRSNFRYCQHGMDFLQGTNIQTRHPDYLPYSDTSWSTILGRFTKHVCPKSYGYHHFVFR